MSRAGAPPNRPRAARGGEAGFTLLEVLAVMLLLGVLAAVAAPRFAALREPSLQDVGRGVVVELRAKRDEAMRTGRAVVASPGSLNVPSGFAVIPEPPAGTAGEPAGILFLPDGRSGGGSLLVADRADRLRIAVDWLTGEVRVVR